MMDAVLPLTRYSEPLVSVIVVNWNGLADLPQCLNSIRAQHYEAIETLVVDNGSSDGSVAFLRQQEDVILIENRTNLGFAAANNQGVARARGSWILLLNTDAWLDPWCVQRLMQRVLEESTIGSASPKIYRPDGRTLDSTGIILQKRRFSPADRGESQLDHEQFDSPDDEEIFGPTGAAALYRREALGEASAGREVFDEDFFAYYEDVDLAWRLQLLGWRSVYVPGAVVYHDRKGPAQKPAWLRRQAFANRYFCYVKNELPGSLPSYLPWALPYEIARCIRLFIRQPSMIGSLSTFFHHLPLMLQKRKWIQARRRVGVKDLDRFD